MKIIRVTYFALATLLTAVSCSQETAEPPVIDWGDGEIYIRPSLSDVGSSRAQDMTLDRLESFQVTCFNIPDLKTGNVSPYFENATFVRRTESGVTAYVSSPEEGTREWPLVSGAMSFFAFSPSPADMQSAISGLEGIDGNSCFRLINSTRITGSPAEGGSSASVGYRLGKVRISHDISRQFDFVAAAASGERWIDFSDGVDLDFSHKLSQVELRAWGGSLVYDFDIAGVRIGNPVVEGTYVFADESAQLPADGWETSGGAVKDKVEYLYRADGSSGAGSEPKAGDSIFRINRTEHNTQETASSIMGRGGCAMVIPTVNEAWEGLEDPDIENPSYSTRKMYFSILMRVKDANNGKDVYPYPGNPYKMTVISYAVDKSTGKILSRLYSGATQGAYFTDPGLQQPYNAGEGVEIMDFGWATVPVDADWSVGKKYVYTLNYTEGIGLHDPADPKPGTHIGDHSHIEWGVTVEGWSYAEKDENYDPDLVVP